MRWSARLLLFVVLAACEDDGPVAPPDIASPLIQIVFPTLPALVDRDNDGLVDLEIRISDSLSGLDPSLLRITANRPLKGSAGSNNLLEAWTVERTGPELILEEIPDALLPRGRTLLTVSAVDMAGNRSTRSFTVEVPPLNFHRHVVFSTPPTYVWATRMVADPMSDRLLIAQAIYGLGTSVFIVDTRSLEVLSTSILPAGEVLNLALDAGRQRLYMADYENDDVLIVSALDGTLLDRVADVDPWARGAVALVIDEQKQELYRIPAGGGLFFADSPPVSLIGVSDLETGAPTRVLRFPHLERWGYEVRFVEAVIDEPAATLFIGTADWWGSSQGILTVDALSGRLLGQIDVVPEDPNTFGGVRHLRKDGDRLLGVSESYGGRVLRIEPGAPPEIEFGNLGSVGPMRIAITPDGSEYVVLSGRHDGEWSRVLQILNAVSLRPAGQDTTAGSARLWDVAIRRDGNMVFLGGTEGEDFDGGPLVLEIFLYR